MKRTLLESFEPNAKEKITSLKEHVNRLFGLTLSEDANQILEIYSTRKDLKSQLICNIANLMRQNNDKNI